VFAMMQINCRAKKIECDLPRIECKNKNKKEADQNIMCECITVGMWQHQIFSLGLEKATYNKKMWVKKDVLQPTNSVFCVKLGTKHQPMAKGWNCHPFSKWEKSQKVTYT
jgi:hypothetical protein